MNSIPNPLYDLPPEKRREKLEAMSLRHLQDTLRQLDCNGWLTLEDEEQNDRFILVGAISYILDNA